MQRASLHAPNGERERESESEWEKTFEMDDLEWNEKKSLIVYDWLRKNGINWCCIEHSVVNAITATASEVESNAQWENDEEKRNDDLTMSDKNWKGNRDSLSKREREREMRWNKNNLLRPLCGANRAHMHRTKLNCKRNKYRLSVDSTRSRGRRGMTRERAHKKKKSISPYLLQHKCNVTWFVGLYSV